ncbi:ankyrin repeat-containing domain protein, partial [Haematococcus lacustris]
MATQSGHGLTASKSNVAQQAKLMDSAGTAWHAVKYGNLEMITKLFPSQCNVYSKGPVGENCFHVALLLNTPSTLAIAKYLVKLYGKLLVCTPYQERRHPGDVPGLYEGETALHISIVNRDFEMAKFLIQSGADVSARCYGGFFAPGSVVYYGEYPLSFAASTGQKDIVSYLKRHGCRVNQDKDTLGNTALHLCVYHDQIEMYEHLVEYCGASEHVRNNRGQTPLLMAASLGRLSMFQHIYNRRRKVAWAYGPVTSYSLSLHEIDSVQNAHSFVPSAVETIVRKGHKELVEDPLVTTLLSTKWRRFAAAQFALQGCLTALILVLQTVLAWLHSHPARFNLESREALEVV